MITLRRIYERKENLALFLKEVEALKDKVTVAEIKTKPLDLGRYTEMTCELRGVSLFTAKGIFPDCKETVEAPVTKRAKAVKPPLGKAELVGV